MNRDLIAWQYECAKRDVYFKCVDCPYLDDCDSIFFAGLRYNINVYELFYIIYAEGEI